MAVRVFVFGDSIGQGFYDEVGGGWVQRLQRHYFTEEINGNSEVNIINLSVSGHTSHDVRNRISVEIASRDKGNSFTILAIGVNDSYERNGGRKTDESEFEENTTQIILSAKKYGKVLVLGCTACVEDRTTPTSWDSGLFYYNENLKKYESILQKVACKNEVDFIPLWKLTYDAQQANEMMPDGIHPNARGHEIIYDAVKKKLKDRIS